MLPEAKKKLIFTIIAIIGVILVIIIMYNLAKFMKDRGKNEVIYDDPYPTIYDYYAIEYSDEGTYKLIGFDENFTRNDLDLRIFFPINTLYWRNNHLAFYSDATNELRYNKEEEKYYLYELDTFYSNKVDITINGDYLILVEKNTLSYRNIDEEETKEITNNLVDKNILIKDNLVYYVVTAGIYEYDLETGSSKLIMIKGSNNEQKLVAISNKFLVVQSEETIYSYEFDNGSIVTINDRIEEEEGTSIKYIGLFGTTLVYQVLVEEEYILRTYSLEINSNTYQDFSLGYEQIDYSYPINDKYVYANLKLNDKERYVIIDIKEKKVIKELENQYKVMLEVVEDEWNRFKYFAKIYRWRYRIF